VFWVGGLVGAFFGLAGIFVAACLYLFYALVKLVFLLAAFTAQLIFAISGLIARAIAEAGCGEEEGEAVKMRFTGAATRRR